MTRANMINGSSAKQSLLVNLVNGNTCKTSPFRVRRNKWCILKFLLLASLTIYMLLYLKSLFTDDTQTEDLNHPPSHVLPLQYDHYKSLHAQKDKDSQSSISQNQNHANQASPDPQTSGHEKSAESHRHRDTKHTTQTPWSPLIGVLSTKKRKLIAERFDVRKRRIDEQLKELLPTIEGWGDNGKGVVLKDKDELKKAKEEFRKGAFNVYISDRISPNRTVKRVAPKECFSIDYNENELPTISVVIIFTDEIFSALVRTIWSVINRTPKRLLREIILVDDFSEHSYLREPLRDYIDVYLNTLERYHEYVNDDLVKLVHLPARYGLIKARLTGANMAKGDTLVFLDSHCEVTHQWAEPLVQRIKDDRTVFVCPVIDIIDDNNIEYHAVDPYYFQVGGFDWNGHFTWINRRRSDTVHQHTTSTASPTMAGGLFAVDRKYFFEVGSYDEDMKIWGGENLELSFRVWQCGGKIEIHPCSHVGHIFREFHPYSFKGIDSHGYNTLRTVRVWMDEFSRYFFMNRPDLKNSSYGDITKRLELKDRLGCKSFQWYLDNIYEKRKFLYDKYVLAYGYIRNDKSNMCIDVLNRPETADEPAALYVCEDLPIPLTVLTNQLFTYTSNHELRREAGCLTINIHNHTTFMHDGHETILRRVLMSECEDPDYVAKAHYQTALEKSNNQKWTIKFIKYDRLDKLADNGVVLRTIHKGRLIVSQSTGLCLSVHNGLPNSDLVATKCDPLDLKQRWQFQKEFGDLDSDKALADAYTKAMAIAESHHSTTSSSTTSASSMISPDHE